MKGLISLSAITLIIFGFCFNAWSQTQGDNPDIAYDIGANRYLMVFEQPAGLGSEIVAEFRNADGSLVAGSPVRISDPRPTQGCFYGQFDSQNNDITTPTDCPQNKNPSVSFNNGQYLIAWEVHGTASVPSSSPDNQFINIFAQIVDAGTLNPLPGWEEGILISKIFIAANNAESQCGDKHACNDGQIQAWSQSINPDVAPRLGAGGFVVTWQSNKDFIGCADPDRRRAWSVQGRYVDQSFSATSTTNPPLFAVFKDDSTMMEKCEPQSNVDNGVNPRIAFNQTTNDFVIVYEVARASGGNATVGAKRVTLNAQNAGQVEGSIMPSIVASVDGVSLTSPDVVSFKNNYVLFVSDGTNIRAKSFSSGSISSSTPAAIDLGAGNKTKPRGSSTVGPGGERPSPNSDPERVVVAYEQSNNVRAATLNESLAVTKGPLEVSSGISTNSRAVEVAGDLHDLVPTWNGQSSGSKVFAGFIDSAETPGNNPPTVPSLIAPADPSTFAPTRAFLDWNASTDPDGDTVTYNLYFGENVIPGIPQVTGLTETDFVIGPETQTMTGITLQASRIYKWKVEASDGRGGLTSSPIRTLNTDNSVIAWYRFDDNPAAIDCTGEAGSETVCDTSGKNNHGVPTGGPTWLPPAADILGRALDFDGVNDGVTIANDATLDVSGGGQVSIEAWVEASVIGGSTRIIATKGDINLAGPAYGLFFTTPPDESVFYCNTASVSAPAPALGVRTHLAGSFGSGFIKLYTGAVLSSQMATGVVPNSNSTSLTIGKNTDSSRFYDGIIDEVIIYSKEVPIEEIGNHFQAGNLP